MEQSQNMSLIEATPCIACPDNRRFIGEHWDEFTLINMNGRVYDPVIARFLSPDPYVQAPESSQNFNRYSYCLNNPLNYTDPSGEIIFTLATLIAAPFTGGASLALLPTAIGADIGMWQGGTLANGGEMNPFKWDYSSGKTWGYMAGGAAIGAASGYVGGAIAAEGGFMANTMGLVAASHVNSVGMFIMSGGQTDYTLSFGVASYNFTQGEWGYLGKPGNTGLQNFGYFLGAMANLNDINNLINQTNATLYTQERYADGSKDIISHTGIVDDATGDNLMSFGPNDNKIGGGGFKDQIGGAKPLGGYKSLDWLYAKEHQIIMYLQVYQNLQV
jgi:RHS repeat-associated protein